MFKHQRKMVFVAVVMAVTLVAGVVYTSVSGLNVITGDLSLTTNLKLEFLYEDGSEWDDPLKDNGEVHEPIGSQNGEVTFTITEDGKGVVISGTLSTDEESWNPNPGYGAVYHIPFIIKNNGLVDAKVTAVLDWVDWNISGEYPEYIQAIMYMDDPANPGDNIHANAASLGTIIAGDEVEVFLSLAYENLTYIPIDYDTVYTFGEQASGIMGDYEAFITIEYEMD